MKSIFRFTLLALALSCATSCARERTIVILSTNDMHAKIQGFPALASAVAQCRDTVAEVLLFDAGDKWTGNAFVDRVEQPGAPIVELMNELGYDAATLGNHEFDFGQEELDDMLALGRFKMVCANMISDQDDLRQVPPYVILKRGGVRIGVVGVVSNYEGPGYPAGHAERFEGLQFPDPQLMATQYAIELRPKVDILVLLSHMGDNRDAEFLTTNSNYDVLISGHTHNKIDTLIGHTHLSQTGSDLKNVGATIVRMRGREVLSVEYRLVSLADYQPDMHFQQMVDQYYQNSELKKPVGEFSSPASRVGMANWMAQAVRDHAQTEIGIYHVGGVRIDTLAAGGVSAADIFSLEPFNTQIATMSMSPEALREMIIAKYNDKINAKESHRIDLVTTTPYQIVVDAQGDAVDVLLPELTPKREYTIALSDYIFKNYKQMVYTSGEVSEDAVGDALLEQLDDHSPIVPNNTLSQGVVVRK